ncbi:MAG: PIN domain-containing protein [Sporichthyaceae bacterium]
MPGERSDRPEFVFDAGAFIAWEKNDQRVREIVALALTGAVRVSTSSAVIAQVWRGGPRQARLARLLGADAIDEFALAPVSARQIGLLAADRDATDVVDGHVAMLVQASGARALTSDPQDLAAWGVHSHLILTC